MQLQDIFTTYVLFVCFNPHMWNASKHLKYANISEDGHKTN